MGRKPEIGILLCLWGLSALGTAGSLWSRGWLWLLGGLAAISLGAACRTAKRRKSYGLTLAFGGSGMLLLTLLFLGLLEGSL